MDEAGMIAAIAAKQLGAPPAAEAAQTPQTPPGAPPAGPAPNAEAQDKDTATDKAMAAGAPVDEGTNTDAEAILYEIEMGGKKRKLTPQQISSTMERYSALNYKQAQYKPVLDLVEEAMKANPGATPADVASHIMALVTAQKNQPQGAAAPKQEQPQVPSDDGDDDPFTKWEKENAASLPPGYKDMMNGNKSVMAQLQQMQQMLAQVLGGAQGVADAARAGQQDARQSQVQAIQQSIANNIDRVQAHLQLPDDAAEDFMTFAAERGYTLEDFIDPRLTLSVMTDFKNNMASPEFERLKAIHTKRQAWTGQMGGSTPTATTPDTTQPPDPNGQLFGQLAQSVVAKRLQNQ
jgi:hypothetical protein